MKLVFLGTAGDSQSRQERAAGGLILRVSGGQYHLDPGPGALSAALAAKVSLRDTICVLASNNSLLASGGLNDVVDAMTLGGLDPFGVIVAARSVFEGSEDEHPVLSRRSASFVERVITFDETRRIGVNELNIYPCKARHVDPYAIGFRLETSSLVIGYTGDTRWFAGLVDEHKGSDVLIIKCSEADAQGGSSSLDYEQSSQLVKKVKPKVAVLTGFGAGVRDPLALARKMHRECGVQVVAAKDGYVLELDQFVRKG